MILFQIKDWQPWFAWRPVFLTEGKHYNCVAWLRVLERRRNGLKYPDGYRLPGGAA